MAAVLPVSHSAVSRRLTGSGHRDTHKLHDVARWIDSWMPGAPVGEPSGKYPGERLGLPADGVGAVAGFGRRLAALAIDWLLGYIIAGLFTGPNALADPSFSWTVLGVWFLLTAVPVAVFGASTGMTALGIRVAPLGGAAVVGVPRALLRTALIALVIPAVIRDEDLRGWHDRATGTVVVRTRA
jgi:uncharacterized RDD family membrane protein YckC